MLLNTNTGGQANAFLAYNRLGRSGGVSVFHVAVGASGSLTSEVGLITTCAYGQNPPSATDNHRLVRIGTDRKVRLYDYNGTLLLGPTTGTISTTGLTLVTVVIVSDTYPGNGWAHDHAYIFIDGVEDVHGNITWSSSIEESYPCYWGEYTASAAGADLYLDDASTFYRTDSGYAPWQVAVPIPRGLTQWPAADGYYEDNGWTGTPDNTNKFNNWDNSELPENDGDASYNYVSIGNQKLTSQGQSRATVGIPLTATIIGCWCIGIHRYASGSKYDFYWRLRLGTTDLDSSLVIPTSTYSAAASYCFSRPGGGDWTPSDLDSIQMGAITGGGATDEEWRITLLGLVWTYSTESLPLATAPPTAVCRRLLRGHGR
jgi:hypothetical protein